MDAYEIQKGLSRENGNRHRSSRLRSFRRVGRNRKFYFLLTILTLAFMTLPFLTGCGPTRKEYAINEALLIDQTRVLEDQLYRAYFQVQQLEYENARLRERLAAHGEEVERKESTSPQASPVPFDQNGGQGVNPSIQTTGPLPPARQASPATSANPADVEELSFPITQNRPGRYYAQPVRTASVATPDGRVAGQRNSFLNNRRVGTASQRIPSGQGASPSSTGNPSRTPNLP